MKNIFNLRKSQNWMLFLIAILAVSCSDDDNNEVIPDVPTAQEFNTIQQTALNNIMQEFEFDAADGYVSFISENGVEIYLNTNCLTLNGNPANGSLTLDYAEIFEGGNMLTTNKPTMGLMDDGVSKALLISGGEFYLQVVQNGQNLDISPGCISLIIPTSLTNSEGDQNMTLWEGVIDTNGDLTWNEIENDTNEGVFIEGQGVDAIYYAYFDNFGWTNVDVFYNDPRPKTTIYVGAPEGYNNENCAIYLHYVGVGNSLAHLDTYDATSELFSEHYGQIPIGLECQIIFTSESNGNWRYAVKPVTITANTTYSFDISETSVTTEAELTAIINALP